MNVMEEEEILITEANMKTIGYNLKRLRRMKGYSQEKVANEFGISPYHYRQIEHGATNPTIKLLSRLAMFFGVELKDFLEAM